MVIKAGKKKATNVSKVSASKTKRSLPSRAAASKSKSATTPLKSTRKAKKPTASAAKGKVVVKSTKIAPSSKSKSKATTTHANLKSKKEAKSTVKTSTRTTVSVKSKGKPGLAAKVSDKVVIKKTVKKPVLPTNVKPVVSKPVVAKTVVKPSKPRVDIVRPDAYVSVTDKLAPVMVVTAKQTVERKPGSTNEFSSYKFEPYATALDEKYMNERQLLHFRRILNSWKRDLMREVDNTILGMKESSTDVLSDLNDRATQEEVFNLELRTRDRERKLLKKIEDALQQIDDREYGYCESCGIEIGIRRLEARPTAVLCIDCKTLDEIREKRVAN